MTKKVYGSVKALKTGADGKFYARIQDLNIKDKEVFIACCSGSSDNSFGPNKVAFKEGMRVAFTGEMKGKVLIASTDIKVYEDRPVRRSQDDFQLSVTVGNCVNIASAFHNDYSDLDSIFSDAALLVDVINKARQELFEEFPERDQRDIGAKLGDGAKHAGAFSQELTEVPEKAKDWVRRSIALEESFKQV